MARLVVDASSFVDLLTRRRPLSSLARAFRWHTDVHVPSLCDLEMVSAARRMVRTGQASSDRAWMLLSQYRDLPLVRHEPSPFLEAVWHLRDNFTAYDASYVALAKALQAQILTTDGRLRRAVAALDDSLLA